jgi:hypothetical protein
MARENERRGRRNTFFGVSKRELAYHATETTAVVVAGETWLRGWPSAPLPAFHAILAIFYYIPGIQVPGSQGWASTQTRKGSVRAAAEYLAVI